MKKAAIIHFSVTVLLFAIGFMVTSFMLSPACKDCENRKINWAVEDLLNEAQTGDIIFVKTFDLFSKTIEDLGNCDYSSSKIIYRDGGRANIIISDAGNLVDISNGLEIVDAFIHLATYPDVRVALYRPKNPTLEHKRNIENLISRAKRAMAGLEKIEYDPAFDNSSMQRMTCQKLLLTTYGDYIVNRSKEDDWLISSSFPCDLKTQNLEQIVGWTSFWKE